MVEDTKTVYHGIKPFMTKRLTWGEDALKTKYWSTQNVTKGNVCAFKTKTLVLEGNEKPELSIFWLTEFNEKVICQVKLSASFKYSAVLDMVQTIALAVCRTAYSMATIVNENVDQMFTNVPFKFKL